MATDGAEIPPALSGLMDVSRNQVALGRQPVSDEIYAAYAEQLVYQSGELNASQPVVIATTVDWVKQRVARGLPTRRSFSSRRSTSCS
jgi:hypothetical protein